MDTFLIMKLGKKCKMGRISPIGSAWRSFRLGRKHKPEDFPKSVMREEASGWVENVKSEDFPQSVVREEASGWVENVKSEDFPKSVVRAEASGLGKNIKPEDFPQV